MQETNHDEEKYDGYFIGSFTKNLKHNKQNGNCKDPRDFLQMKLAVVSGKQVEFDRIKTANGSYKLVDPQASYYSFLIGAEYSNIISKVPPSISSKEFAAEMVELYCMEISRDLSFDKWSGSTTVNIILDELNKVKDVLLAPTYSGSITVDVMFRGNFGRHAQLGPYISQFLYHDVQYGDQKIYQKYKCAKTRTPMNPTDNYPTEFCIDKSAAIHVQDGNKDNIFNISDERFYQEPRYIHNGKSLAEIVHSDALYQFYYNATNILLNLGCPVDPGFPTYNYADNFTTIAGPVDILHHVAAVAGYALKHAWYQKWRIHRRVRPEAAGILLQNHKDGTSSSPLHPVLTQSKIIEYCKHMHKKYYNVNSSYMLSSVYPEGSPCHPSYPAGHAVVAGACCTVLKIFFKGDTKWTYPVYESNHDGTKLHQYSNNNHMSVNSEINKLGSNVALGRNWANVHYRSDGDIGMIIGEEVAIQYMKVIMGG